MVSYFEKFKNFFDVQSPAKRPLERFAIDLYFVEYLIEFISY